MSEGEKQLFDILQSLLAGVFVLSFGWSIMIFLGINGSSFVQFWWVLLVCITFFALFTKANSVSLEKEEEPEEKEVPQFNEPFKDILVLAHKAILNKDQEGFLLAQKKMFLTEYSTIIVFCEGEHEKETIKKMVTGTMLCIADLDKQWNISNGE